jgi:hypothetical protein
MSPKTLLPGSAGPQRGTTILVVLVLLTVMLLGAAAMARMTESSTLSAGNAQYRDASLQASELGLNTAFNALQAVPALQENQAQGGWYFPTPQPNPVAALPTVDWGAAPLLVAGAYEVRYVVERLCSVAVIDDPLRECLVKAIKVTSSAVDADDRFEQPNARQYRVTVRVTGPKNTTTFVQALLTKG